jgi:hypothetical protein
MALRLLQERARGDDSMWALYLPSLPTEIPALWWLAATQSPLLHEVHYPMAVTQATLMATDVRNTYHTVRLALHALVSRSRGPVVPQN